MQRSVSVIDYGLSNLNSIARALERCGARVVVTQQPDDLANADNIVLPGVGSFPAAMQRLRERGIDAALKHEIQRRAVPVLGICLGMQLLAESSEEVGKTSGLALIPGDVVKLEPGVAEERIPHIGWNSVDIVAGHDLFTDVPSGADFYFVHSYHLKGSEENVVARTPFCGGFASVVAAGPVMAVQFHPEKSQRHGLRLLNNFLAMKC